jgi:glycosyltransferase involved in cell wall biosynthesis
MVSVVMAVHNGERYVRQAIDSILAQTFTDFELVLINDGSTDETPRILVSYQDPRIVLIENEKNLGLTKTLNRGIRVSRGEFIARQDADDYSLPDRLAQQVSFLDAHPTVGLAGSGSRWIDERDETIQEWCPPTDPVEIQRALLASVPFLHGTFMVRRVCLQDAGGGYNEAMPVAQDCDLLFHIAERWELANLPQILYVHRRHKDTVSAKRGVDQQHYFRLAQRAAIRRRLALGLCRLGLSGSPVPQWVNSADRRWLARRFVWWSAGARELGRGLALRFLLIALLLDPLTPEIWRYLGGILVRKVGLGNG